MELTSQTPLTEGGRIPPGSTRMSKKGLGAHSLAQVCPHSSTVSLCLSFPQGMVGMTTLTG